MEPWLIPMAILLCVALLAVAVMLIIFFKIFFSFRVKSNEEYPTPEGAVYDPYREQMVEWVKEVRAMKHECVSITSYDGLKLRGKYFEYAKGAPIEILFHGYKGSAERDMCGGVHRCFSIGHSALIVDHRASGESEGRVITFGAKESRDCLEWVNFVIKKIDSEARIILTGISMGAATVMIASSMGLPENVVGVLADCGYTSTEAVVRKVMRDLRLPDGLLYPLARLGARIFGGFDTDEVSPIKSMAKCRLPIIFFHGDADGFVPCYMSEENYKACASERKRLVITKGADHGLCFPVDGENYLCELRDFFSYI